MRIREVKGPIRIKSTNNVLKKEETVGPFLADPYIGHLATPIVTSIGAVKFLNLLPIYKKNLSFLLRGIFIGFIHGYILLGPFFKLGPLRNTHAASFIGFLSAISLVIVLSIGLALYGYVIFSQYEREKQKNKQMLNSIASQDWHRLASGFFLGGFGGSSVAYALVNVM